jgi:regulator-associated protein of mTOR
MLSDPDSRRSSIISESDETEEVVGITTVPEKTYPLPLNNLFSDNVYLSDPWHDDSFYNNPEDDDQKSTWRMKDKMKTAGVALVVCLNLGTDPPDVVKPNPCARKECWYDPVGPKQKGLEIIGNNLQQQYEKWQSKAKYKQCLDPTSEDLRRVCMNLRKAARNDRLLLHYNGHGVPRPTRNGELWVFGKHYTHYMPVAVCELRSWLGDPSIYVLDCSGAGALMPHFIDPVNHQHQGSADHSDNMSMAGGQFMYLGSASGSYANVNNHSGPYPAGNQAFGYGESKQFNGSRAQLAQEPSMSTMSNIGAHRASIEGQTIVLAACKANEILPMNPQYPADIFTSCLTTPIPIAVRWFILQVRQIIGHPSVLFFI